MVGVGLDCPRTAVGVAVPFPCQIPLAWLRLGGWLSRCCLVLADGNSPDDVDGSSLVGEFSHFDRLLGSRHRLGGVLGGGLGFDRRLETGKLDNAGSPWRGGVVSSRCHLAIDAVVVVVVGVYSKSLQSRHSPFGATVGKYCHYSQPRCC